MPCLADAIIDVMVNRLVDCHIYYDTHAMGVGFEEESILVQPMWALS